MGSNKMLVAIDGSEAGYHALLESFKLATNHKSWITVTSVVPPYQGDLEFVAVGDAKDALKQSHLEALAWAEQMAKENRVLIKTVLEEGKVYEEILDRAEAENAELIVMGRRGKNRFERTLIGSATARVIGYSQRDVLVIPPEAVVGWKRILVAVDGSKYSDNAVDRAIDFAKGYEGTLNVLSVANIPQEFHGETSVVVAKMMENSRRYVDDAVSKAEAQGVPVEGLVKEGPPYQIILDTASELGAETIVIASHGKTGLKRLLMGSVTEHVVGFAHCPVLVTKI
jgi:nucleotide-binding universal stress UspA family protein